MVKLTDFGIYKCKRPSEFTTLHDLCKITGKQTLEELIALDFTPYIAYEDLKKISLENIYYYKFLPHVRIRNKNKRTITVVPANNFYLTVCDTPCINHTVCNQFKVGIYD